MIIGDTAQRWQVEGGIITQVTRNGVLWQVHKFIANGDLIIRGPQGFIDDEEARLYAEYLLVAGGGGGGTSTNSGSYAGGGGGAGGVRHGFDRFRPGTYGVAIGPGGAGGVIGAGVGTGRGAVGGNSTFNGLIADGGGYGGYGQNSAPGDNGGPGGNGGGGGMGATSSGNGGAVSTVTTPAQGNPGQPGYTNGNPGWGGGLGHASPVAQQGYWQYGMEIKNGFISGIDGISRMYACGGQINFNSGAAGAANTGNGGNGAFGGVNGGAGGSGVFVLAFPIS